MSIVHISSMVFFAAVSAVAILSILDSFLRTKPPEAPHPILSRIWHIAILVAGLGWLVTVALMVRHAA